jgi:afadin
MHTEGLVTVTPHSLEAETYVDGQRVTETTVLRSGATLQFGASHVFKFVDPSYDHSMGKGGPGPMMRGRHKSG